jgi:hypothetical protein
MRKILLLVALALLPLQACQEKLPKPTQEGKNTFACKINGQSFIGEDSPGLFSNSKGVFAAYVAGSDYIVVRGSRVEKSSKTGVRTKKEMRLYVKGITGAGVYELNQFQANNGPESYAQYDIRAVSPHTHYLTLAPGAGQVKITKLDTVRGIIAGTFSFKAVNPDNPADVVNVTSGRFDISTRR